MNCMDESMYDRIIQAAVERIIKKTGAERVSADAARLLQS